MLKILIVAAIVSMTISMIFEKEHRNIAWIEGAAILSAVFIVSFVTAWNDYKKEEQFIKLSEFKDDVNVIGCIRSGKKTVIKVDQIQCGDLLEISQGMEFSVDGILIRGSGVTVDESAMTGETDELKKGLLSQCEALLQELKADGETGLDVHSVPSPLMLSGS